MGTRAAVRGVLAESRRNWPEGRPPRPPGRKAGARGWSRHGEPSAPKAATGGRSQRRKPTRRLPPEVLTEPEVRALLAACGEFSPVALRNRALIAVLYRSGLRISEALALEPKDVDLDAGQLRVMHGKGDRHRVVGIDPGAGAMVAAWVTERDRIGLPVTTPLLSTMRGTRVTTAYVRRWMKQLAAKAGIAKRVHAHGLRHTHAAQLRSEGFDIGIISKQLGHRSILTTIRYLDHVQPTAVIEAVRNRAWPLPVR